MTFSKKNVPQKNPVFRWSSVLSNIPKLFLPNYEKLQLVSFPKVCFPKNFLHGTQNAALKTLPENFF